MGQGQKQLSEFEGKGKVHIPYIWSVSSLNLRMGRGEMRKLDELIGYECSVCGKKRVLGVNAAVLVKMEVDVGRGIEELHLCDACIDVVSEAIRFGPRVIDEARTWVLKTRVARVSAVQEELVCFKCMGRADSHMFIKYDDCSCADGMVRLASCSYGAVRVCARCVLSYLELLRASKVTRNNILKECPARGIEGRVWKTRESVVVHE
jgi:hypothetical protein